MRVANVQAVEERSGKLEVPERLTLPAEEPGTYRYKCGPHPGMMGVIVVG